MKLEDQVCNWKAIPGFDGLYEASDNGFVRSIKRSGSVGGVIKQHKVKGYMQVWLSKENQVKKLAVHRAVLMAFDRPPKDQEVCNHKDGNRENNSIMNLEWCTREYNEAHKKGVLGQDGKGEKNANFGHRKAKLYPSEALRNRLCELGIPRYRHNLAELGEMLPRVVTGKDGKIYDLKIFRSSVPLWVVYYTRYPAYSDLDLCCEKEETEADARAKMLIYLIEQGLVKP